MYYDTPAYTQAYSQYAQTAFNSPSRQTTYGLTTSSTIRDDKDVGRGSMAPTTVMLLSAIVVFIFASAAITLLALGFGSQSSTETTETESTSGYAIYKSNMKVELRTATPTVSTTLKYPHLAMIIDEPLVCTVGNKINSTQMLPPDGVCDYIFFDSLYKSYTDPANAPTDLSTELRTFVDAYPTYQATAFGVGIAYTSAALFATHLNQNRTSFEPLKPFWDRSIYHFGVLDTQTVDTSAANVIEALKCLKALHLKSREIRVTGTKAFTFFAAAVPNDAWAAFLVDSFKNTFEPELFVAIGHYARGDNTLPDCVIMPPTVLHRPSNANNSYQHDLTSAAKSFATLSTAGTATKLALSVTLKGRFAVPTQSNLLSFLDSCVSNTSLESFASYAEVCKSPDYSTRLYRSSLLDATQVRHHNGSLVFSYDGRAELCKKVCTVKAQHTSLKFGIAVFDVDYADFSGACSTMRGPFPTLHALRRVLDFFKTGYTDPANMTECTNRAA